jgi:hypothetical protein
MVLAKSFIIISFETSDPGPSSPGFQDCGSRAQTHADVLNFVRNCKNFNIYSKSTLLWRGRGPKFAKESTHCADMATAMMCNRPGGFPDS